MFLDGPHGHPAVIDGLQVDEEGGGSFAQASFTSPRGVVRASEQQQVGMLQA
jgi:hypothetical protein